MTDIFLSSKQAQKLFWFGALLHTFVWSLVPTFLMTSYRHDTLDLYSLGREWTLASLKHPNFPAWVLQLLNLLTDYAPGVPFFASQIFILLALVSLWQLGRQILSESSALIGSLVFCLFFYCNFRTVEYNHHCIVALSLWTVSLYLLYNAFRWNRIGYWIAVGFSVGLGVNTHFLFFNLCFAILVFMLWNASVRRRWLERGPYISLLIAIVCFLPQIYQMVHTSYITSFEHRFTETDESFFRNHIFYTIRFLFFQIIILAPLLFALLPITGVRWKFRTLHSYEKFDSHFLLFFTFFPIGCILTFNLICGGSLSARYGSLMWSLCGLLVLFHIEQKMTKRTFMQSGKIVAILDSALICYLIGICVFVPLLTGASPIRHFPIRNFGTQTQRIWNNYYSVPCPLVGGEYDLAAYAGIGMNDHPLVGATDYDDFNVTGSSLVRLHSDTEINQKGGMVFWTIDERYPDAIPKTLYDRYPEAKVLPAVLLESKTCFKNFPLEIGVAVIPIP
jgi:hypothetical protein